MCCTNSSSWQEVMCQDTCPVISSSSVSLLFYDTFLSLSNLLSVVYVLLSNAVILNDSSQGQSEMTSVFRDVVS